MIITENDIIKGNKIKFTINNVKINIEIIIDDIRKIYTNKVIDATIIEIKENDKIDKKLFLVIDDQIFKDNLDSIYKGKSIYLIGYPNGVKPKYVDGIIKQMKITMILDIYVKVIQGSLGCPIINLNNNRVLGIHKGGGKNG